MNLVIGRSLYLVVDLLSCCRVVTKSFRNSRDSGLGWSMGYAYAAIVGDIVYAPR